MSGLGILALDNDGLSCWKNSVLQLLTPVPDLWTPVSESDAAAAGWRFDRNLHQLLMQLQTSKWDPDVTQQFTERYIRHFTKASVTEDRFPSTMMNDAHEFAMLVLDRVAGNDQRFRGVQTRITKCDHDHVSTCTENFFQLNVENVQQDRTLVDFMAVYYSSEMLNGDDKFYCDACGEKRPAVTSREVTSWPEFLLIQVGRFGSSGQKLHDPFEFPTRWSGSSAESVESAESINNGPKYRLVTAVMHEGRSLNAGHYVAYGRVPGPESDEWMYYSDSTFHIVDRESVQSPLNARSVYLLLYQRIN